MQLWSISLDLYWRPVWGKLLLGHQRANSECRFQLPIGFFFFFFFLVNSSIGWQRTWRPSWKGLSWANWLNTHTIRKIVPYLCNYRINWIIVRTIISKMFLGLFLFVSKQTVRHFVWYLLASVLRKYLFGIWLTFDSSPVVSRLIFQK